MPALILSITFTLSLAMVLFAASASANHPVPAHRDRCLEQASTQLAMNDCADKERRRADRTVRALLKRVVEGSPKAVRAERKKEQRAWMETRAIVCRKEAAIHEGGSILPLVYASCLSSEARARAKSLRALLSAPR